MSQQHVFIRRGLFIRYYEPYDMPGSLVRVEHSVLPAQGQMNPESIEWNGPGHQYGSTAPAGFDAWWLGAESVANPHIVYVSKDPTLDSDEYYQGYRHGWRLTRRPRGSKNKSPTYNEGVFDGWRQHDQNKYQEK